MINKLLITCLQRNKRLIIPTLGAFIRKNIDGVGVILVFVPFLNKDDGVLLGALQSWAGVDKEEAEIILKEYIECIRKSLEERGQYIIEGIGVLKYDANHMIYLAKEGEAIKEASSEVVKAVEPVASVEVASHVEEAIDKPTPIVEKVAYVQQDRQEVASEVAPSYEPVSPPVSVSQEDSLEQEESVVDDKPQSHSAYGMGSRRGTRYFTPEQSSVQESGEVKPSGQRKNTINNLYGSNSRTSGTIYGSAALDRGQRTVAQRNAPTQTRVVSQVKAEYDQEQLVDQQPQQRMPKKNPNRRPTIRHVEKPKKKIDVVMVVAAIAVVVTIISMVYAFFWSSDSSLEDNISIEQSIVYPVQVESGVDSLS